MKLRQKFFLSYFFIISTFSIVFVCSLCFFFAEQAQNELLASAEKTFSQTAAFLDYQYQQYLYSLYMISNSEEVAHAIEQADQDTALSIGQQYVESIQLRNILHKSILPLSGASARLYVDKSYADMTDHQLLEQLSILETYAWFHDFKSRRDQTVWIPTNQTDPYTDKETATLSLFRKVGRENSWIAELYIPQANLQKTLSAADPTEQGAVFLQSEDGTLLCGTNDTLYRSFLSFGDPSIDKQKDRWITFPLKGQKYSCYTSSLSSTGQTMTLILPMGAFPFSPGLLPKYALWILAGFVIVSIAAAHFFTNSFSRRLLHLDSKMAALCAGDLDTRIERQGNDEVTHLFDSFNHMAGEMKLLVQQQYENGVRVKTAELNALQAQINPHFLYNTLELINWKAMESDAPEIVRIAQDLADFYRLTLSNGRSIIPLNDELELIYRYLDIQNFRFSRDIRLLAEVSESCLDIRIPKLTLQPLVENSVLHGFLEQNRETGQENLITLKVWLEASDLLLLLTDNGSGMSREQFDRILSETPSRTDHGFGVSNIQHRIQMLYGEDCGLTFSAAESGGVSVLIRLKSHIPLHERQS